MSRRSSGPLLALVMPFFAFDVVRVVLLQFGSKVDSIQQRLPVVLSDAGMHSLRLRLGYDVLVFIVFATSVAIVSRTLRTWMAIVASAALSVGSIYYPVLIFRGTMPIRGFGASLDTLVFMTVMMALIVTVRMFRHRSDHLQQNCL